MEHPDQFSPSPTDVPAAEASEGRGSDVVDPLADEAAETIAVLPTMADLDRLSADLDQVDATLVALDRDVAAESGS